MSGWLVAVTAVVTVLTLAVLIVGELIRVSRGAMEDSTRWAVARWSMVVIFAVLTAARLSSGA